MVIRFGRHGVLHVGRPADIGARYDAAITLCWHKRDAPPEAPQWRGIVRVAFDLMPVRRYRDLRETGAGVDSTRWTGRTHKFLGFAGWRRAITVIRSTRRSPMYVYLTGAKERANPRHVLYVTPAAYTGPHMSKNDVPEEWMTANSEGGLTPKMFTVVFVHGRAEVEDRLGEWLIATHHAQRTNLVRATAGALLGNLASLIAGR